MNKTIQLLIFLVLMVIYLPSCSMNETDYAQEKVKSKQETDTDFFSAEEKEKLGITDGTSVELYSNPNLENQYFVKVVTEVDWSEMLYRVTVNGNKKSIEVMLGDEGYAIVDDVTFYTQRDNLELPNKYIPILLAVTTSSHMGNGNTIFYAFTQDGTMDMLLNASHTVDREKDTTNGAIFENGRLSVDISENKNGSEYSNIVFKGREYMYGVKDNDITGEYLYQIIDIKKLYSFNNETFQYEETSDKEDIIQTVEGVTSYTDFWKEQAE